jgi:hypothetical protein
MFDINDRNLVIVAITVLVIVYIIVGKSPTEAKDIIEKAIIALGSLATGSIARDSKRVAALTKKVFAKEKDKDPEIGTSKA